MTEAARGETIILLVNDAIEAERGQHSKAALLLIDAALSILVTRHRGAPARREMAGMLAEYVERQVSAVIAAGGVA